MEYSRAAGGEGGNLAISNYQGDLSSMSIVVTVVRVDTILNLTLMKTRL